jgi:hypothetical protein
MRIAYTGAQKREAVALARVAGIEAAADSLRIDPRTVRGWVAQAGDPPELDGNAAAWQRAFDLAHAKVEGILASGKASAVTAATIMGIAQRNIRDLERDRRPPQDASQSAVAARDEFDDWLVDTVDAVAIESEEKIEQTVAAVRAVVPKLLLRRANAEADPYGAPSAHRVAILAWFSGRPEVPAGDILEWSQAQVLEVIETHGSLVAWHAFQQAEEESQQVRREAEMAEIEARAAASRAGAEGAIHDAEVRARQAAAELSRKSTT